MLTLYKPSVEGLWFREQMMSDEQTMAYNHAYGGTIPFPKEYWADWHDRWLADHDGKHFYRYIKVDAMFIGEVADIFYKISFFIAAYGIHLLFLRVPSSLYTSFSREGEAFSNSPCGKPLSRFHRSAYLPPRRGLQQYRLAENSA